MISYGNLEQKGADEPNPAYMHHCQEFRLRNDNTASDGLNGSITVDENDLHAVGAEMGDPVRVYAEANGRWILYERGTYNDRAGVGMPKSHREKLGLDSENREIELWLDEPQEIEPEPDSESEDSDGKQVSLTGEEADEQEYVVINDDSPFTYHHVDSSNDHTTECGLDFEEKDRRRFTDPGDALDECSDCAVRSSDEMTNKELVDWLGEQAGFEATGSAPAYLSKEQLVALRDYVLELQDAQADDSTDEVASASVPKHSALSQT